MIIQKVAILLVLMVLSSEKYLVAQIGILRNEISLNGAWQIEESLDSLDVPTKFNHTVNVPGLVNMSIPSFPNVDEYESPEMVWDRINIVKPSIYDPNAGGSNQKRNFFWYRRSFVVDKTTQKAFVKVNKAQFGSKVWLNGHLLGENDGCYTSKVYDATGSIKPGTNELLIRVGAHPGMLPKKVNFIIDFEKAKWTPGLYDNVSLILTNNPVIEYVQVAPLIWKSKAIIQTKIKNYGGTTSFNLSHKVYTWKERKAVSTFKSKIIHLNKGEEIVALDTIDIPDMKLWSPESPFLYVAETNTGGDKMVTRFGMREFKFETATKRAYLNGKIIYLRGSNITLHRFFEDSLCNALPWNEKWLQKLLVDTPKLMNWNSFRFCIGPVPERWLEIADEAGLLIQNEFAIWTLLMQNSYFKNKNTDELTSQFQEWLKDGWNHPSVVLWDANNETLDDLFNDKIIPSVRPLDISNRPWENSFNRPNGSNDPVENHPYLFNRGFYHWNKDQSFKPADLEQMLAIPDLGDFVRTGHPIIINEYGWIWVNRNGQPTMFTKRIFDHYLGKEQTPDKVFKFYAYYIAGLTEYWRAYRNFAGVLHFTYLTYSNSNAFTSDNFVDVEKVILEPYFQDYVRESFKPLGVYLNFWQPQMKGGIKREFTVMMINDEYVDHEGTLTLSFLDENKNELKKVSQRFNVPSLGQNTYFFNVEIPDSKGKCEVRAVAASVGSTEPTLSRRETIIE